jgi:hypothetical protein
MAELMKMQRTTIFPKVKLYMNDETFVSGGITNASPFLLAFSKMKMESTPLVV